MGGKMPSLNVTNHAVLRWIERRYGIKTDRDMNEHAALRWLEEERGVEVEVERRRIANLVEPHVADHHRMVVKFDGLKICVRNYAVVTVLLATHSSILRRELLWW